MIKSNRLWITLLLTGIFLLILAEPLAAHLIQNIKHEVHTLKKEKEQRLSQIRQWETDAMTAEALSHSINTKDIEKYLAPSNRNSFAAKLDLIASASIFSHFTFSLSPTEPWAGNLKFPNFKNITQSHLVFEADAPYDTVIFHFLDMLGQMAGRIEIKKIILQRNTEKLGINNIHVQGDLLWLANSEKRNEL